MFDFPASMKKAIFRYDPISIDGVTLYPVTVEEMDVLQFARPALTFVIQSLPPALASRPLLEAFFQLDMQAIKETGSPIGLFFRSLTLLALALRLNVGMDIEQRARCFSIELSDNNISRLKGICFTDEHGDQHTITPIMFSRIREVIAAQNGVELPSEHANPELLESERDLAEKRMQVEMTSEHLISAVAALTNTDEREILQWPVLKLRNRGVAIERVIRFAVNGICAGSGAKWKGGNPVPHPFYPKIEHGSNSKISIHEFAGGAAAKTVLTQI